MPRFNPDAVEANAWCPPGDSGRPIVWNYGGGVQTAAIAALVVRGDLPRPDHVVMADTAREGSATWDYLRDVLGPALASVGLSVEVASHDLATKDLFDAAGKPLMPVFSHASGEKGQTRNYCSGEWKRDVVRRYLRSLGYGQRNPVEQWFGMSADEVGRLATQDRKWLVTAWPLAMPGSGGRTYNRAGCRTLVRSMGWPDAPKSSCWCCPYRTDAQWRDLRDNRPEDWANALAVEAEIRAADPVQPSAYTLHPSGLPLAEADAAGLLDAPADAGALAEIPCTAAGCWT